ncbi:MAG: site-specific tyrosine recombinase XerD [Bacteroidota bacterium]
MSIASYKLGFKSYLMLEKGLSENSIQAYLKDIEKLQTFLETYPAKSNVQDLSLPDFTAFFVWLSELGFSARSQARISSGIKSFFSFLKLERIIEDNPTLLLETPKLPLKIPEVLSIEEIESITQAIDLSHPYGHRNKTIIETLYSCGLRVSELIELKITSLYLDQDFVRVIGKGNKERLVPIGQSAKKMILTYLNEIRIHERIEKGFEDHIFLNRFGKRISRISVFNMIKELVSKAGIRKKVSPHTFRHSFATHLVEGGADLRAVQEMLGHKSITTTEIYTHLDRNYLRSIILDYHPLEKAGRAKALV